MVQHFRLRFVTFADHFIYQLVLFFYKIFSQISIKKFLICSIIGDTKTQFLTDGKPLKKFDFTSVENEIQLRSKIADEVQFRSKIPIIQKFYHIILESLKIQK